MEKEFVPYEQALALKELGFDEPCFGYRDGGGYLMIKSIPHCVISAPTFSQAFRWFREKYNLHIETYYHWGVPEKYGLNKNYTLLRIWKKTDLINEIFEVNRKGDYSKYKSYEEAELECLKKLIEIVKIESNGK